MQTRIIWQHVPLKLQTAIISKARQDDESAQVGEGQVLLRQGQWLRQGPPSLQAQGTTGK